MLESVLVVAGKERVYIYILRTFVPVITLLSC